MKWTAAVREPFDTTENGGSKAWQPGDRYELQLELRQLGGEWRIVGF